MSRKLLLAAAAILAMSAPVAGLAQSSMKGMDMSSSVPAYVTAAVADSNRPEADVARDDERKPGATVAFAGVKPGDKVIEMLPGGGYFTRILSKTVGPKGKIYAVVSAPADPPKPSPVVAIAANPAYSNVVVEATGFQTIAAPEKVDVVWTSQNYHDMHNMTALDLAKSNKSVFEALKPGGVYMVLDHAAAPTAGLETTNTLHRINPAIVKREVEAAGFRFEGESKVLLNSADDHTLKVFDPAIRGHTDQFIFKFRKPK